MSQRELCTEVISTGRLRVNVLRRRQDDGVPVIFIHGNTSSSLTFSDVLAALPPGLRAFALDLRGFGATEPRKINATRGVRDFSDDVRSLVLALGLDSGGARLHLVGWSMGGAVALQYAIDHPAGVASLVLEAPISPYGFLGSRDVLGTPCWPDWSGSGAGVVDPEFVRRMREGDRSEAHELSPRRVIRDVVVRPDSAINDGSLDRNLSALLSTRVGDDFYPGDQVASPNWPFFAPGTRGVMNAMSGRYLDLSPLVDIDPKPPILWIRGADDEVISDRSAFDLGVRGELGEVPGWPGSKFPPQPMIGQLRRVFSWYQDRGGTVREHVLDRCGHSPHMEQTEVFTQLLINFILASRL